MERDGVIATYIMASGRNGTLCIGVTSDLERSFQGGAAGFPEQVRK